jgi:hypothetical protein
MSAAAGGSALAGLLLLAPAAVAQTAAPPDPSPTQPDPLTAPRSILDPPPSAPSGPIPGQLDAEALAQREASQSRNRRRPRAEETEPFTPTGIEVGSFVLKPTLGVAGGFDSNPLRERHGKGSMYERISGAFDAASDWSRHSLTARIDGSYTIYNAFEHEHRPELDAVVEGRIDVLRDTRIEAKLRGSIDTEDPGDPETPRGAREPIVTHSYGAEAGVVHEINRLELALRGSVDRYTYGDVLTDTGRKVEQRRDYNLSQVRFRSAYEISPLLKPYGELSVNQRDYDFRRDSSRRLQNSHGWRALAGAAWEPSPLLKADLAAGWGEQYPDDPLRKTLSGPLLQAAVTWAPTPLTTLALQAKADIDETTVDRSSGVFTRSISLEVVHALRRWLELRGQIGFERDEYKGLQRFDDSLSASLALEYRLNRELVARLRLAHERQWSAVERDSYSATIVEIGLTARR